MLFRSNVLSVNFGCPQTGNYYWREYFNFTGNSLATGNLGIWRVVLGSDLVARLPQFFYHVGHTIQLDGKNVSADVKTYWEHYGDTRRGYAGAPSSWYTKSYKWLPDSIAHHRIGNYLKRFEEMDPSSWPKAFYPADAPVEAIVETKSVSEYGNEDHDGGIYYDSPPRRDDWIVPESGTETRIVDA